MSIFSRTHGPRSRGSKGRPAVERLEARTMLAGNIAAGIVPPSVKATPVKEVALSVSVTAAPAVPQKAVPAASTKSTPASTPKAAPTPTPTPGRTVTPVSAAGTTPAPAAPPRAAVDRSTLSGLQATTDPRVLQRLEKGLLVVDQIAKLADYLDMMAEHLPKGAEVRLQLDPDPTAGGSTSDWIAGLLGQLAGSMPDHSYADLVDDLAGTPPTGINLPSDRAAAAQARLTEAFASARAALDGLGVGAVGFALAGGRDGAGAWATFAVYPGRGGAEFAALLSIPGLPQSTPDLLGRHPAEARMAILGVAEGAYGALEEAYKTTYGALGAVVGFMAGELLGTALAGPGGGAAAGHVGAVLGEKLGEAVGERVYDLVHPYEVLPSDDEPAPDPAPQRSGTKASTSSGGAKDMPTPDGVGREPLDARQTARIQGGDLVHPGMESPKGDPDVDKFVRGLVAGAAAKVNPNPDGSGRDAGGGAGALVKKNGITGGDPVTGDPSPPRTDATPGGNPHRR